MSKTGVEIIGLEQVLSEIRDKVKPACRSALEEVMEDLRRCASGFTPIDTGHLQQSGGIDVRVNRSSVVGDVVFRTTADTHDYALRMHEGIYTPRRQNSGGNSKFGNVAWRTGSKFLSEPFRQLLPEYIKHVAHVIEKEL